MTDPSATPAAKRPAGFRLSGLWIAAAIAILTLTAAAASPIGGWLQSFAFGTGVRWENAYRALDASQPESPASATELERRLIAEALVDGEAPVGGPLDRRIHRPGTLAHLRYETFDENGNRLDEWQVRALVPSLGGGGPVWDEGCPPGCQEEVTRARGARITRSGDPGIAAEWILRMPVGQTYQLGSRPLLMHDLTDALPRRVSITSTRVGGRSVASPADIRVTLVEACAADLRVGSITTLEVSSSSIIAVPTGFKTARWVQLNGCGPIAPLPAPAGPAEATAPGAAAEAAPEAVLPRAVPQPFPAGAVVVRRESGTGFSTLRVDESWLERYGSPVVFQLQSVCRYDEAQRDWRPMALHPSTLSGVSTRIVPQSPEDSRKGERPVTALPREVGLFWLQWTEQAEGNKSARSVGQREALVTSGPMMCEDLRLGPAPAGQVAACVPFPNRAEARFVPRPAQTCAR